MADNDVHLYDLVKPTIPSKVIDELMEIVSLCKFSEKTMGFISEVHGDIVDLFQGDYNGYKASNAKYHNLEHTCAVALATARLLHGCIVSRYVRIEESDFVLGVVSAYFHDTGLIQENWDESGTGAKYTVGHEQRSIVFATNYLASKGISASKIRLCTDAIQSTNLSVPPSKIDYSNINSEVIGRIVGSADLIAQIADRAYLERLSLLFAEFREARLPGFNTELDLLRQTEDFYTKTAKKRLDDDFGRIHRHMKAHFIARWDIDKDLYDAAIKANISYIRNLVGMCKDDYDCYIENLRRKIE